MTAGRATGLVFMGVPCHTSVSLFFGWVSCSWKSCHFWVVETSLCGTWEPSGGRMLASALTSSKWHVAFHPLLFKALFTLLTISRAAQSVSASTHSFYFSAGPRQQFPTRWEKQWSSSYTLNSPSTVPPVFNFVFVCILLTTGPSVPKALGSQCWGPFCSHPAPQPPSPYDSAFSGLLGEIPGDRFWLPTFCCCHLISHCLCPWHLCLFL